MQFPLWWRSLLAALAGAKRVESSCWINHTKKPS
jgi:hypothetical protein